MYRGLIENWYVHSALLPTIIRRYHAICHGVICQYPIGHTLRDSSILRATEVQIRADIRLARKLL